MGRVPSFFAAHIAMVMVALFYALSYFVLVIWVFDDIDPFTLLALRGILGCLFFGLLGLTIIRQPIEKKDIPRFIACGVFGIALNQMFFLWGMSMTIEVNASVLMTTTPVFVFLIAWLIRQEQMTWLKVVGLILSFVGAGLLSLNGQSFNLSYGTVVGDGLIIVNSMCYAIYLVLVRPLSVKYHTGTLIMWVYFFGGIVSIPVGMPALMDTAWATVSTEALLGTVYVILFITILAYSLNAWALKLVPSSQVSVYIYLQPVLVTSIAVVAYTDAVTFSKLAYISLVLLGVFLVSLRKVR